MLEAGGFGDEFPVENHGGVAGLLSVVHELGCKVEEFGVGGDVVAGLLGARDGRGQQAT